MKKIFTLVIIAIMALSLISCSKGKTDADSNSNSSSAEENQPKETPSEQLDHSEGIVDTPPIKIEDVPVAFDYKDGAVTAVFTNNSEKKITSYRITMLNKSTQKKSYFHLEQTVDPKKTSPNMEASGSILSKKEDMEVQKYAIGFTDENGLERVVRYNLKTKKYILI